MDIVDTDSDDELPVGWEERVTIDGNVYYANHDCESTQWTHPITGKKKIIAGELPFGWEMKVNDEGSVFYVDHGSKKTTYTDPRLAFAVDTDSYEGQMTSKYHVKQRFDASSKPAQILLGRDLSKKHAIVTGANCGIGYETARALALQGANVVLACRDMTKANAAADAIKKDQPQVCVEAMMLDLLCLRSVMDFCSRYIASGRSLHILVLNAGVFSMPYTLSADGYESTFQTNHLGHFYLTQQLEPLLVKSAPARVVVVSSESHRFTDLNSNTLCIDKLSPTEHAYRPLLAYNQSKLCNILFSNELNRRLCNQRVFSNSVHPGNVICTKLSRQWWFWRLLFTMIRPFTKSKEQAASCSIFCATVRELEGTGGYYFNNCCRCEPLKEAYNVESAEKLWQLSNSMVSNAKSLRTSFEPY